MNLYFLDTNHALYIYNWVESIQRIRYNYISVLVLLYRDFESRKHSLYIHISPSQFVKSRKYSLRELYTLARLLFPPRETHFVASSLLYCTPSPFWKGGLRVKERICTLSPFWKGIYTTKKEFAPFGSKFFPYRVDPFLEGNKTILTELFPLKVYQLPFKINWISYLLLTYVMDIQACNNDFIWPEPGQIMLSIYTIF